MGEESLVIHYVNKYDKERGVVTGYQQYEVYDSDGELKEKRKMDINFRMIEKHDFEKMIAQTGFNILKIYGDYDYSPFDEDKSPFIIYDMGKSLRS